MDLYHTVQCGRWSWHMIHFFQELQQIRKPHHKTITKAVVSSTTMENIYGMDGMLISGQITYVYVMAILYNDTTHAVFHSDFSV